MQPVLDYHSPETAPKGPSIASWYAGGVFTVIWVVPFLCMLMARLAVSGLTSADLNVAEVGRIGLSIVVVTVVALILGLIFHLCFVGARRRMGRSWDSARRGTAFILGMLTTVLALVATAVVGTLFPKPQIVLRPSGIGSKERLSDQAARASSTAYRFATQATENRSKRDQSYKAAVRSPHVASRSPPSSRLG